MKKNLSLWQFSGFCLTSLFGTLLHFLYEWTNENKFIAPFSAINESTWEHMKLLYFPLFVFAIVESRFFKDYKNFWCVKLAGTVLGLILIPTLFYTYNGCFGKSPDWLNITIFFVCAAAVYYFETKLFKRNALCCKKQWLAFIVLFIIGILFVIFTFYPPNIPIFKDPTV